MIKIERIAPPAELTIGMVQRLMLEFAENKQKNVWNKEYIKKQLLQMSANKCAYCEVSVNTSGSYMEVEHYLPKSLYPDKVVEWDNLLPSCKRCNGKKGSIDPVSFKMINPTVDNPKDHLLLNKYRIVGKDTIGKQTVEILNLNDMEKLVLNRVKIGEALSEKLENLSEIVEEYRKGSELSKVFRVRNTLTSLLKGVQHHNDYSAILSRILLSDPCYLLVRAFLEESDYWDDELKELELKAENIALEIYS